MRQSNRLILFLMGVFAETQVNVIGFIGISELFIFLAAPFFFITDYSQLRRHGFHIFLWLDLLMFVSGWVSGFANHIPLRDIMRGVATPYAIFAITVVLHRYLSKNLNDVKWLFLGLAISVTLCTFVFQQGNTIVSYGEVLSREEAAAAAQEYSLFWVQQASAWLTLPVKVAYLHLPLWVPMGISAFLFVLGFFYSNSRSSLATTAVTILMLFVGGRAQRKMLFIKKHFFAIATCLLILAPIGNAFYRYCATTGMLGEAARNKYYSQTKGKKGIMAVIMGGRSEFFVGLKACVDQPLIGQGSWARDYKGYVAEFLAKYGDDEDYRSYVNWLSVGKIPLIPAHSYLISFWLWYGIGGLIFGFYLGWVYIRTFKNYLSAIPFLYGFFCFALPGSILAWLFSPFGHRVGSTLTMVLCLFARAVAKNRMVVPRETKRGLIR